MSVPVRDRPFFVVVGPPRSGTSALAWALRDQGVSMFVASTPPDQDSPSGNQEDNLARTMHNHLMGRNGLGSPRDWDNPRYGVVSVERAARLIRAYIRFREGNSNGPWGVKDPRICFLIEAWSAASADLPARWLHIEREDREAVIESLVKMLPAPIRAADRRGGTYRLAANWAESFHLACELGFERAGIEPFRITYEQLLTAEGQRRLTRELGFERPIESVDPRFARRRARVG